MLVDCHQRASDVLVEPIVFMKREFLSLCPPESRPRNGGSTSSEPVGQHVAAIVRFGHPAW
jgi:hypothetical protein